MSRRFCFLNLRLSNQILVPVQVQPTNPDGVAKGKIKSRNNSHFGIESIITTTHQVCRTLHYTVIKQI